MADEYEELHFSYNWNNKLDCKSFTTIRISGKYSLNSQWRIFLKGDYLGLAKVVSVTQLLADNMSEPMALLDTGYNKKDTLDILKKMYPTYNFHIAPIYHITLVYVNRLPKIGTITR